MGQFEVHDAKINLLQLFELVEQREEVIVARHGKPVARVVRIGERESILGIGVGDPNYIGASLSDEERFAPLNDEDLAAWYGGRD